MILHKLTEDILCLSQGEQVDPPGFRAAQSRVQRLVEFCDQNDCALVDDPNCVQIVMSRTDIAQTLERCLKDASIASGIAVRAPRYAICKDSARIVDLRAPMIAKPLIVAGTKPVILCWSYSTMILQPAWSILVFCKNTSITMLSDSKCTCLVITLVCIKGQVCRICPETQQRTSQSSPLIRNDPIRRSATLVMTTRECPARVKAG